MIEEGAVAEVDETRLLDGRLIVRQLRRGHRAGTDAILLAAAVEPRPGALVCDAGSGVGTVGLAIASRTSDVRVTLVEREPALAALARENVELNGFSGRVVVAEADLFSRDPAPLAGAEVIVSNPPFYLSGEARLPPDALKARAYGLDEKGHGDWLRAMLSGAVSGLQLVLIHRPEALPALLAAAEGRLGGVHVRSIQARAGAPATRMLLGGTVGSRSPFVLASPLILHEEDGRWTAEAEALHRGQAVDPLLGPSRRKRAAPKSRPL